MSNKSFFYVGVIGAILASSPITSVWSNQENGFLQLAQAPTVAPLKLLKVPARPLPNSSPLILLEKQEKQRLLKISGKPLIDYLETLRVRAESSQNKREQYRYAYAMSVADFYGLTRQHYEAQGQDYDLLSPEIFASAAQLVFKWSRVESVQEAQLLFIYSSIQFTGLQENVDYGIWLLRETKGNPVICNYMVWNFGTWLGQGTSSCFDQIIFCAVQIEKSAIPEAPFRAAQAYAVAFYSSNTEERRRLTRTKLLSLYAKAKNTSASPEIKRQANTALKMNWGKR